MNKLLEFEINKIQFENKINEFIKYYLDNVNVGGAVI